MKGKKEQTSQLCTGLLIATIRREINTAVARGDVRPDQALAAVMHVVATYLAQVKDDALRQEYLASLEALPAVVELIRGDERPITKFLGADQARH
jgi:predicted nucleotidyltransferase